MEKKIKSFITSRNRVDILAQLAFEHTGRVSKIINDVIARGMDDKMPKLDGKAGAMDGGASGWFDKKDGKDGKDKEKDGKESKEGKEGKESKDGKEGKEGKESKDGKESKEGKEGKDSKEGGKEDSKDGKDKDKEGKDGSDSGKFGGGEVDTYFRYGERYELPIDSFKIINELHNVRLTSLINQPIF